MPRLPFASGLSISDLARSTKWCRAARSGRQNIAEGSRASATSSQTELRLVNVARSSLDELLLDYEDFLRQRHLPLWDKDASAARKVRELACAQPLPAGPSTNSDQSDPTDQSDPSDSFGPSPLG